MSRTSSSNIKNRPGLQLFSDLMLMKFKPKSLEGSKKARQTQSIRDYILKDEKVKSSQKEVQQKQLSDKLDKIMYLQLATIDTVILGNYNQLDMFDCDGLINGFVDTYHYWSFCPGIPIMNVKVNIKKQMMMIYSVKVVMLYRYQTIKRQYKEEPELVGSIQLKNEVLYMQTPSPDIIALFYSQYFEIYSVSDSFMVQKKLQKKYNIDHKNFSLFSVPAGIDNTINIFFQQKLQKTTVFGLWCIQINVSNQTIRQNQAYKIYDILKSLKSHMFLRNYSKDMIVLNLGQQILVASKGYIVDSVNINLQKHDTYLKLIPQRQILLHIQQNFMEVYNFKINTDVLPHRIELTSIDSIEITGITKDCKLLDVLPLFHNNYALFYQVQSKKTTKGEIFYKFMMSYTVKLSDKINRIMNLTVPLSQMSEEKIQSKCDVLRKIGLTDQQIYLQFWKRSNQSSIKDYQFLLSTRSYKIIKNQIESKMRKTSMKFKELIKIEESCLEVLKVRVSSQKCERQDLQNYLVSHLLLRKLKLFKEIHLATNKEVMEKQKGFVMNIQEYHFFKNFKMKQVVQKIGSYLSSGQATISEIRTILYHFRFVYRFIYHDILQDIVKQAKNELKRLLVQLPELLPIKADEQNKDILREGIWGSISDMEWQQSMYYQKVVCLYNKDLVNSFIKEVWFRRNWLYMHDMITMSTEQIISNNNKNKSNDIFYFFIEKVFQNITQEDILDDLLTYIQNKYQNFPSHLRDRVILYSKLYLYHQNYHEVIKEPKMNFSTFLTLQDYDLFKFFFQFQKIKKGCLIRQIRQIYLTYADQLQFNNSLLNYFKSQNSQISHLKYLLNRINNQKKEFHFTHQNMYAVLVKAMQIKLKIGSENDIPIDEVLIYLQNIPITSHNNRQIINDLEVIQRISEQYQTLKKMKINMTIKEIIDNYEVVMEKLVDYQIQKYQILQINVQHNFISATYRLLAQIQSIKKNIYGQVDNQLALFIFFTKCMEHEDKILFTSSLLKDQYINNYFYIDIIIVENMVRYMKRWKLSEKPIFIESQTYLETLVQVLPQENQLREFILLQLKFAKMLSVDKQPVKYPLALYTTFPRIQQLEEILTNFEKEVLKSIDIQQLISIMKKLKDLSESATFDPKPSFLQGNGSFIGKGSQIDSYMINKSQLKAFQIKTNSLRSMLNKVQIRDQDIYQLVIKIYIKKQLIREALPLIKKSIEMSQKYDIITILILIYHLLPEFNEESKIFLIKIISRLYNYPLELLAIMQNAILNSLTALEMIQYLKGQYLRVKDDYLNYNPDNLIFNTHFRNCDDEVDKQVKKKLVKNCLIKVKRRRVEFRGNFFFDFLYIILCYHPQSMSIFLKFLGITRNKMIRSFFSHLITQQIFDEIHVLEVMKRIYFFILKSLKQNRSIYTIVRKYDDVSLVQDFQIKQYSQLNDIEKKVFINVKAFQRKKKKLKELDHTSPKMKKFLSSDKQKSIKKSRQNPDQIFQKQKNQYVFSDSDDDYKLNEDENRQQSPSTNIISLKTQQTPFNPEKQRRQFWKNTPIKSREQHSPKSDEESPNKGKVDQAFLNPLDIMTKSAKMRKYFSQDVRSHYDEGDESFRDQSMERSSQRGSIKSKKSLQIGPFIDRSQSPGKDGEVNKRASSTKKSKVRATQSLSVDAFNKNRQELSSQDNLFVQNKKSEIQKSEHEDRKQIEPIRLQIETHKVQKCEISDLLQKTYKTFRPQLENEPYSLKSILQYRSKNKAEFNTILSQLIETIYLNPSRDIETALRLQLQIAEKIPEAYLNKTYLQIVHKIAKLQSKYSLDLPLQKMFTLQMFYSESTSLDELFQLVKPNLLTQTGYQNIQKIAKLISLGFKRSSLESTCIEVFLKKQIQRINRLKDKEKIDAQIEEMKTLYQKLNVKMLIQLSDSVVKKATCTEVRKKIAKSFADIIRSKGKGRDANELIARFK